MFKRLTRWMVRRFLPDFLVIKNTATVEEWKAFAGPIFDAMGYHLSRNPPKGIKKPRKVVENGSSEVA